MLSFTSEAHLRETIGRAYEKHRSRLAEWLPSAEIHHIGSTAIPGAWTKGDLDILIRVSAEEFASAEAALAAQYTRNEGSDRNEVFASFVGQVWPPPVGIQLVARGSLYDDFLAFRDALLAHPLLLEAYNSIKRSFERRDEAGYREE